MALTSDQTSAWTDSSFVLATSPSPGRARLQEGDIMTLFPGPSRDVEAWHFDATDAPVTNDTHLDLDSNGTFFGALNDSSFEAGEANGTDDYDYDYEIALETFFWRELTPTLVVYAVTYVLGVVGNALIIFTIYRYRRLKTTTNVFLASLATADLLLILMCIPVKIARLLSYSWTMGYILCKLIYFMQAVSSVCSVLTLTTMSLERCYAIVYPMKAIYVCTISKAKKAALVIWISSLILASPTLVVQVHMEVGQRVKAFWCVRNFDAPLLWRGYETYMLVLVLLVPACIMGAAYAAICASVVSMVSQRRSMTSKGRMELAEISANGGGGQVQAPLHPEDKTIRQVVPMLIVVVVLFIICWGPLLILNILLAYDLVPNIHVRTKYAKTVLDLLSYFNSCMNPVVYGFMSRNFRKGFKRALCNIAHRDDVNQSLSHSHNARPGNARNLARLDTLNGANNAAKLRKEYGRFGHTPTRDSAKPEFESCHM